jgi:flagellar biosynthesis/type III secretory pathway protein FliH
MNYEELTETEKEAWSRGYQQGYDFGYDEGFETGVDAENNSDATDEAYERGYNEGFDAGQDVGYEEGFQAASENDTDEQYQYEAGVKAGIEAEQNRIQYVLNMMFESSLNLGKGNDAVWYKNMMDLLKPMEIAPYTDED